MEGKLIFCADSILRFRSNYDDSVALPLLSIQNTLEPSNPHFLLKFFRHHVEIEKGTTLAAIFYAIEPWAELLSAYLDRDVVAYICEIRKPSNLPSWDLEWIGLYRHYSITRAYEYRHIEEYEDLSAFFNRERKATQHFNIEHICAASGFKKGDKESYSISEDIHEIKKLPVMLYDKQFVSAFCDEDKKSLFSTDVSGIYHYKHHSFLMGDAEFSFYEVMEAIFIWGLFYDSPRAAKQHYDELREITKDFKQQTEQQEKPLSEVEEQTAENNEDKPLKIEIAEGAFDSLIDHQHQASQDWQDLKGQCKKQHELPIRVGTITVAVPPEIRFNDQVFDVGD